MKDGIRVVLVDPAQASRQVLIHQLEAAAPIWLTEICVAYRIAAARIAEIRPDVTIVVADANPDQAGATIASILEDDTEATVLAASRSRDSKVVLNLVRSGSREVLALPVGNDELLRTLERLAHPGGVEAVVDPSGTSRVIAVTGASGEVGCTSIAVNLATTLAKSSAEDVALIDYELMFGGIDAQLDVVAEYSLTDVVRSVDRIDLTLLKRMLYRHVSGVYVLPRPVKLQESAVLDADSLRQTLALLKAAFPCVVVDTSKSLQASDFAAFEAANVILVVVQLDPHALRNTRKLLDYFRDVAGFGDRIRLVANRVGSLRSALTTKQAEETLEMPISWEVPNATKIFHAARDRGVPIDVVSARCDAQRVIGEMARALAPSLQPRVKKSRRRFFRERSYGEA